MFVITTDIFLLNHPEIKKYEIYEIPEDVLALSVAWKRIRQENTKQAQAIRVRRLLDTILFEKVIPEDRVQADNIRDYYSKKLMVLKLKDSTNLTRYRQDLTRFVQGDGKTFQESYLGLAYYLPMFYEYDCDLDYVRSCVNTKLEDNFSKRSHATEIISLQPIKKIRRITRSVKSTQYWFKESLTDNAVCITIGKDNDLEHIWNYMFNKGNEMRINGTIIGSSIDSFTFINLRKWQLVLD